MIIGYRLYCYCCIINTFPACTAATGAGGLESLIDIGLSTSEPVASEYIGVPATSSDPVLDDFLAGGGGTTSEAKPAKKEDASLDDLDFWLSSDKPAAKVYTLFIRLYVCM